MSIRIGTIVKPYDTDKAYVTCDGVTYHKDCLGVVQEDCYLDNVEVTVRWVQQCAEHDKTNPVIQKVHLDAMWEVGQSGR